MDKENLRKTVESTLRSVAQSCKGGVPIRRLQKDYKDLLGSYIPYQDLGYNSLEAMLNAMPNVVRLYPDRALGTTNVVAVADETTAHIASLVARQKTGAKKILKARRYLPSQSSFSRRPVPNFRQRSFFPPSWNRQETNKPSTPDRRPIFSTGTYRQLLNSLPTKSSYEIPPRFLKSQPAADRRNLETVHREPPRRTPSPFDLPPPQPAEFPLTRLVDFSEGMKSLHVTVPVRSPVPEELMIDPPRVPDFSGDALQQRQRRRKSPTLPTPPPTSPPILSTAKEIVAHYAARKGIRVEYNTTTIGQKTKNFISSLKLGEMTYSSYHEVRSSLDAAEEEAAKKAVMDIEREDKEMKLPETDISDEEKLDELMSRIQQIVCAKSKGIWSTGVPEQYESKFQETLPENWLSLVEQHLNTVIEVSTYKGISHPKGARILRMFTASGSATPTSTTSNSSNLIEDGLRPLLFPDSTQLPVIVSSIENVSEIYVRPIDDKFVDLVDEMSDYYSIQLPNMDFAEENKLYAASSKDATTVNWHRVQVQKYNHSSKKALCYFVDIGDTIEVDLKDLRELDCKFKSLTYQATHLQLAGLEEFSEIITTDFLVHYLLDKTLIADVISRVENHVRAVLYDTSGEEDKNMNEFLLFETFKQSLNWELPEVGFTTMGYLVSAAETGVLYLRLNNPEECLLETELEKLAPKFNAAVCGVFCTPVPNKVYVTRTSDCSWYRTVLVPNSEACALEDEVEMFFVDYAKTAVVKLLDVCDLEPISRVLSDLPAQAVPCALTNIPSPGYQWTVTAIHKLCELATENEELIVRVDERNESEEVEIKVTLCKRNADDNIVSINETLHYGQEKLFRRNSINGSFAVEKPKSLDLGSATTSPLLLSGQIPDVVPSTAPDERVFCGSPLSPPLVWDPTPDIGTPVVDSFSEKLPSPTSEIPAVGSYFNVYVALAASPSNFIVQPLKSSAQLTELLKEMQNFYNNDDNLCDMHMCLLKEKLFYSALHSDRMWYRAQITKITSDIPVMAAVQFVDFGDYSVVEMNNLQPLYQQFKSLPCQAIKAALAGVKTEWTAEEGYAFKTRVEEKSFVSIISGYKAGTPQGQSPTLELELIDTSQRDKDVNINELLSGTGV